jgi:hypothetical protein
VEAFSASGTFFLPGSEEGVRGEFSFDGTTSAIGLTEPLIRHVTAQGQVLPYEGADAGEHSVIYGHLDDGERVTLLDCRGSHRTSLTWMESWRCALALVGGHAESDASTRVSLQFDVLKAWADPPPVINRDEFGDDRVDVLDTSRHELGRATVGDQSVALVAAVEGRWGGDIVDVRRRCILVLETEARSFSDLADGFIQSMHELLILLLGRPVSLESVFVTPTNGTRRETYEALYTPVQSKVADETRRESLLSWGHPTTFTRTELPMSFDDLIVSWASVRERYREAITLLCGGYLAPFMYLEHRYSTAFQSAEHIARTFGGKDVPTEEHRHRVKTVVEAARSHGVPEETVGWAQRVLRQRNDRTLSGAIEELLRRTGPVGAEILERCPSFPAKAAAARADVSHPSGSTASTNTFYWFGEALTWTVRAYLLSELGADLNELHEHITQRGHFPQVLDGIVAD